MNNEASLMQRLIESSHAVVYLKDEHGRLLMVNRRFAELFQTSKEQIIGKTDSELASKEIVDTWRANDRKVTESGTPMTFEEQAPTADGLRTVLSHKFPVSNIEGSPNAVGGISIDITKQ